MLRKSLHYFLNFFRDCKNAQKLSFIDVEKTLKSLFLRGGLVEKLKKRTVNKMTFTLSLTIDILAMIYMLKNYVGI